jgi:hypothetical protein
VVMALMLLACLIQYRYPCLNLQHCRRVKP